MKLSRILNGGANKVLPASCRQNFPIFNCRQDAGSTLGLCAALFFTLSPLATHADDWPNWRGPKRNGISTEKGWSDAWPKDGPPIAWKSKVGIGFSSFAVAGGRVFTTGHAEGQDTVFCLDADTGKVVWKHSYPAELGDKYFEGGTSGTPTVTGDRVFTLSRWGDAFCFDATTGKVIWSKNVQKETGAPIPDWGFSGSPTVHENLVLLNVGEAGLGLDKATGKIVWESADKDSGYSTPLPIQHASQGLALVSSGQAYIAVNPATGKEAWRYRWLTEYGVNASDPIVDGDRVFISTGYGKGAVLLKLSDGEPKEVWKNKVLRTQMNPAVLLDGYLYGVDGDTTAKGVLKCIEFATSTQKWSQPGVGSGALIAADGKLIVLTDRGELQVGPASPEGFKPISRAQVLGGKCWTVPVLANGRIYARNARGDVVCVDVRKNPTSASAATREFERLHRAWQEESETVKFSSNPRDYITLPSYRKIVAMGQAALPSLEQTMTKSGGLNFLLAYAAVEICGWDATEFRGGSEQEFRDRVLLRLRQ